MTPRALVVGAAGGVGSEVVRKLLAAGYQVTGSVLNEQEAAQVQRATPGVDCTLRLDLSDGDSVLHELRRQSFTALDAVIVCDFQR